MLNNPEEKNRQTTSHAKIAKSIAADITHSNNNLKTYLYWLLGFFYYYKKNPQKRFPLRIRFLFFLFVLHWAAAVTFLAGTAIFYFPVNNYSGTAKDQNR